MSAKCVLALVLLQLGVALAVNDPACSKFPYVFLLPLSKHSAAQTFCTKHYPLPQCTSTATATAGTITTVTVPITDQTATSTTSISSTTLYTSTSTLYVYTSTVTATATTGTSTDTVYTSTSTSTVYTHTDFTSVYTRTATAYETTGTITSTTTVTTLPTTLTTTTITSFSAVVTTTTVKSGTVTVNTVIDHGLKKRRPGGDPYAPLFSSLTALEKSIIKTACSCIEIQPPCQTTTSTTTTTQTSFSTIEYTTTQDVGALVTADDIFTSVVSTDTTSTTSILYVTTTKLVQVDTTSLGYTSTISTVYTTTISTVSIATSRVTAYSTSEVAITTTKPSTSIKTVTIPATTTTASTNVNYKLAYGPVDGCAYEPADWIDQYGADLPSGSTHAQRVEICAQFCDRTPGCVSFGMNFFPPCAPNGESVYCLASQDTYTGSPPMECGIGTAYNGCSIYQDGTVYMKN